MYPDNFPPTPQPLNPSEFLALDVGSFLCPRWEHTQASFMGASKTIAVKSLIEAAIIMQVKSQTHGHGHDTVIYFQSIIFQWKAFINVIKVMFSHLTFEPALKRLFLVHVTAG